MNNSLLVCFLERSENLFRHGHGLLGGDLSEFLDPLLQAVTRDVLHGEEADAARLPHVL